MPLDRRTKAEQLMLGESVPARHCRAMDRYTTRPDREGFSVFDLWTGETVVIAMVPQDGMSREDADHTAKMLNARAERGDRTLMQ